MKNCTSHKHSRKCCLRYRTVEDVSSEEDLPICRSETVTKRGVTTNACCKRHRKLAAHGIVMPGSRKCQRGSPPPKKRKVDVAEKCQSCNDLSESSSASSIETVSAKNKRPRRAQTKRPVRKAKSRAQSTRRAKSRKRSVPAKRGKSVRPNARSANTKEKPNRRREKCPKCGCYHD